MISDTHERWPENIPDGDILVHAGDHTMMGEPIPLIKAGERLRALPHKHKVIIAGNHDWGFEYNREQAEGYMGVGEDGLVYLENEGIELMGLKFWGSPVQPEFHSWAFNVERGEKIRKIWEQIPEGLDVLITHGPPRGILDTSIRGGEHCGCDDLLELVKFRKPRVHVFGHIHGGYGWTPESFGEDATQTTFYNASVVNEAYKVANAPWAMDFGRLRIKD